MTPAGIWHGREQHTIIDKGPAAIKSSFVFPVKQMGMPNFVSRKLSVPNVVSLFKNVNVLRILNSVPGGGGIFCKSPGLSR